MNIIEEIITPFDEFCEYLDEVVFKDFKKAGEKNGTFTKENS